MSLSNSRHAYVDCFNVMDQAMADTKGIRVMFKLESDAKYFRMRCNQARAIDRRESLLIHKIGDPLYNISAYDVLRMTVHEDIEDNWWVYFEKLEIKLGNIESLSSVEDQPLD